MYESLFEQHILPYFLVSLIIIITYPAAENTKLAVVLNDYLNMPDNFLSVINILICCISGLVATSILMFIFIVAAGMSNKVIE